MTSLAPTLQAYFTTRLTSQYGASPHTLAAYRDTWRLLLGYAAQTTATAPVDLDLSKLDADLINGFLTALETQRGNGIATRNARLAAVHSFFTYASHLHPEHLATIGRVLAIPPKRRPRNEISYLTDTEVTALLAAPDQATRAGRRDHAMFQLAVTAGLRVSELTALQVGDVHLGVGAHVLCRALAYAEQRFGELEMPCQVRESGLGDVGQLGIILVADRGFLHAGPWVSGEGGDGDDESVRGGGEWPASAVQARF